MSDLTFYYTPMSSATRVHWALEELGVSYEKIRVDLAAGEQKKPEYLALNPNGKIPLLVAEGEPIFESLAILLYLGERFGVDKGLFPAPSPGRAVAFKWMAWGSVTLTEALFRYMRNTSERFPADERNAKAGESAKGPRSTTPCVSSTNTSRANSTCWVMLSRSPTFQSSRSFRSWLVSASTPAALQTSMPGLDDA